MSSRRYKIWLEQSDYDIQAANISYQQGFYEWATYQSVQSVEKSLKAVLVHAGWRPPMTHKLGILLSMCNKANRVFENIKLNFRPVEAFTFISRYPFVYPGQKHNTPHEMISRGDAETCIKIASELYEKVIDFLKNTTEYPSELIDPGDYYFTEEEIKIRIETVKNLIIRDEKLDTEKIILFGSFARESTRPRTTTMDFLIIANTDMSFIDRIQYVREITRGGEPIIEPLIYTPTEFEYMLNEEGEGFLESAIEEGKEIWTKSSI